MVVTNAESSNIVPVPPASSFERSVGHRRATLPSGRVMATLGTVERRRASRALRRTAADREREVAVRMSRRFFPGTVDLLLLDIRYWQIRRCGWDVRSRELRRVGRARDGAAVLCDPTDTLQWQWWIGLHPKSRTRVMQLSGIRLVRP